MQHEFNNRIAAQRSLLRVINSNAWPVEDLFGLSSKAIERWVSVNSIDPKSKLVNLVTEASSKLFFLANKSQEQITDDYRRTSDDISSLRDQMLNEIQHM